NIEVAAAALRFAQASGASTERPIRPQTVEFAASSNNEYATGVTTRVSTRQSDWPPITTTDVERLIPEPGPLLNASGAIPATNAIVVIRIGRNRSRLAWISASCRSIPFLRNPLV